MPHRRRAICRDFKAARWNLLHYAVFVIVGAVVWVVLGMAFGDRLFAYVFSWDDHTPSHVIADTAWAILHLPAIIFDHPDAEPLDTAGFVAMYALNGIAWGLAIALAIHNILLLRRKLRIQSRRDRRQRREGPVSA